MRLLAWMLAAGVMAHATGALALAEPHQSTPFLPTSNGAITAAFDVTQDKLDTFLEHPYQSASAGVLSRNFLYDSYPGIRVGTQVAWLNGVPPTLVEYVAGTGIVHVERAAFGLQLDEYDFAPMGLSQGALFTALKVTRTSGSGAIDVYSLYNYHLGSGSPSPGADSENIAWNAQRDGFYEWGPSGVAFGYASLGTASTHHGSTPNNPYNLLLAGSNLADDSGTGGATTDAVCGLQFSVGDIAVTASVWVGWFSVLAGHANAASAIDAVRTFVASRTPDKLLADETSAWQSWQSAAPSGSSTLESSLFAQAQAMLRMAQVRATDGTDGQVLAAIAPGAWNITWVRDMAYSTVALARAGHAAEAKRALAFQMGAPLNGGGFQSYVGAPYQISVVRYYGNGSEWSDTNSDGPNVEFDGFGLFLWALETYVNQSGDMAALSAWWPTVKPKIADVLVSLQEPGTGLISPDSSIWEVHWNGHQSHFAYTTAAAARGLCAASRLATKMGDATSSATYLKAGQAARDAILAKLRAPDGSIGQSLEALTKGSWLDAAAIEALSFGLIDPQKGTAQATLGAIQAGLVPPSGRGFFRDQGPSSYDSSEWVFVDLRVGRMLEAAGQSSASANLLSWNVAQGVDNFGILSELHDPVTGDYAGAAPMVGFGAGAYILSLLDRGQPVLPSCDAFAYEPALPSDAGPDATADASPPPADAGADASTQPPPASGGCGCNTTPARGGSALLLLPLLWIARRRRGQALLLGLLSSSFLLFGCGPTSSTPDGGPVLDAGPSDAAPDVEPPVIDVDGGACQTTFMYVPPPGTVVTSASVSGEWNSFSNPGTAMTIDAHGNYVAAVALPPGFYGYKLIINGAWQLDPASTMRKYVGGIENSAITATDCTLPSLTLGSQSNTGGHYTAHVSFVPGAAQTQLDASSVTATLRKDFTTTTPKVAASEATASIDVDLTGLASGKYTLFLNAKDRLGRAAPQLRLVFWVETQTFDWRDSLIYMAVTDRLENGDKTNDVGPTPNVDPRADFHNGDLAGVKQVIDSGALDQLGIRVLWLTPFNTNPTGAYLDSDGVDLVTGYHGYWPVKGREVDPRLGGSAALQAVVTSAHAHGIRVLMDFVIHHVHELHEYTTTHPDWFKQGCLCGSSNCDWTVHRLDCIFATYMPNIDWTNTNAAQQFESDAVWWADTFDLDGFRMDAVKQVPDLAVMNVATVMRKEFEPSGVRFFMTGETAMGWSDCDLSCNAWQYQLVSHYIGPWMLDGQFDFSLYYAVPMQAFAYDYKGMIHADYWTQASGWEYPTGSIMSPYIGSQDTPRFVTLATYRGQDSSHPTYIPGNKWTNVAAPPNDTEPYGRLQVAMSWLLGLPGAPMIYYGDEYGEWGGADPNNRHDWRGASTTLSPSEQATLALTRKLGQARKNLVALRRGAYVHVYANQEVLLFARVTTAGDVAFVAINKTSSPQSVTAALPPSLGVADGTTLTDALGGPSVKVSGGTVTVSLGGWGQQVLAP